MGGIGVVSDQEHSHIEWLCCFAVFKPYRAKGIGRALFNHAFQNLNVSTKVVRLNTLDRFDVALSMYQRAGF